MLSARRLPDKEAQKDMMARLEKYGLQNSLMYQVLSCSTEEEEEEEEKMEEN